MERGFHWLDGFARILKTFFFYLRESVKSVSSAFYLDKISPLLPNPFTIPSQADEKLEA